MTDIHAELAKVFQDTQRFYAEDETLAAAVKYGKEHTALYEAKDYPPLPSMTESKAGEVRVIQARSFEAALSLHREFPAKRIAVLNFADARHPGGGVKHGIRTQEEALCRCSTLYPTITQDWLQKKFYNVNKELDDFRHTDACIYSHGVVICKTDEDIPKRMEAKDFVTVDVITCAAPNLIGEPLNWHSPITGAPVRMDPQELYDLHVKRAKHILHVAAANGVDLLVLGAFGCGAFENDPYTVAKAYCDILEEYKGRFERVVFAIYYWGKEIENFKAFNQFLGERTGECSMSRNLFSEDVSETETSDNNIIVLCLGNAGHAVARRMMDVSVDGVCLAAADTDGEALKQCPAPHKFLLKNPETDCDALVQSIQQAKTGIVILIAGMGGRMGNNALPRIAQKLKDGGILTLGFVFAPFSSEAQERTHSAHDGIDNLKGNVDALMVLECDKLLELNGNKMLSTVEEYAPIDDVPCQVVRSIADLLNQPGLINLDLDDIREVLSNAGRMAVGFGSGSGKGRSEQAANNALKSPFMPASLEGMEKVLMNITTGADASLAELSRAAGVVHAAASPNAESIWGHTIDEGLQDSMRMTVIMAEGAKDR